MINDGLINRQLWVKAVRVASWWENPSVCNTAEHEKRGGGDLRTFSPASGDLAVGDPSLRHVGWAVNTTALVHAPNRGTTQHMFFLTALPRKRASALYAIRGLGV